MEAELRYRSTPGFCVAAACASLVMLFVQLTPGYAQSSAIAALIGSWGGSGRITYTDGSSESIRCTAFYSGGGNDLRMSIQCHSDKNPINIRSQLRVSGSRVSGDWEERTFNAAGTASGSISSSRISLTVSGGGISGNMTVSIGKSSHNVTINTEGIAMSRATISLSKR